MKDEIKEINIPENVLVALGDLTNGALNYYKATKTVEAKHNIILDYITNLQEEIKEFEQLIDIQDNRKYRKRYLEERRKEEPNLLYPDYDEIYKRYYDQKDKIDKANNELEKLQKRLMEILKTGIPIKDITDIQDILRGEDNE